MGRTKVKSKSSGPRLSPKRAQWYASRRGMGPNRVTRGRFGSKARAKEKGKLRSIGRRLKIIRPRLGHSLAKRTVIYPSEGGRKLLES